MDRGYQLVIRAKLSPNEINYLYLDTCTEKRVTSTANIPTQPLQNGNTMSDHMYRNPDEFTVSGTFGLYGAYAGDIKYNSLPYIGDSGDRLSNIQRTFEYIKDNGILCDLTTMDVNNNGSVRFRQRNGMALKSITWVETQTTMNYTFTFQEVMSVEFTFDLPEGITNGDYPNINAPEARSLGQIMIDNKGFVNYIIAVLYANGYISEADAQWTKFKGTYGTDSALGEALGTLALSVVAGAAGGALAGLIVGLTTTAAIASSTGVGLAIGLALGITAGIILAINNLIEKENIQAKKDKAFKLYNGLEKYVDAEGQVDINAASNDNSITKNVRDWLRLEKLSDKIYNKLSQLTSTCSFYAISSDENDNKNREMVLNIENNPYYISITKGINGNWEYSVKTIDNNGEDVDLDGRNGASLNTDWTICKSFDEMDINKTCLFVDKTKEYEVYLYRSSIYNDDNISNDNAPLYQYQLVVSKGPVSEQIEQMHKIINDVIESEGFI